MAKKVYNMQNISDWENSDKLIGHLAQQLTRGRIAIVLGAGISIEFKLPDWEDLIKKMYKGSGKTRNIKKSLPRQAEFFKKNICNNDELIYKNKIQEALYKKSHVDFKYLSNISTLSAISSLVMASQRGSASNVVTFNFDNLLELYLSYHGYVINSRKEPKHWSANSDVNIYHPHGYIPAKPSKDFSKDLVFDLDSYSNIIGDESNAWRQHILSIMRSHFCIFIGLSGNDDNFNSILKSIQENHISIDENGLFWGITFRVKPDEEDHSYWENRGIFIQEIDSYEDGISDFLYSICQNAASFRK